MLEDDSLIHDYDSFWKEALDEFLPEFLELFAEDVHSAIDWSLGFKPLDTELQSLFPAGRKGRLFVDRVYEVFLKDGSTQHLAIHIEVQVGKDGTIVQRAYAYYFRLREKLGHAVWTLLVLADDDPGFRPGPYEESIFGLHLSFAPRVIKLADYQDRFHDLRANQNPFALLLIAWLGTRATPPDRLRAAFKMRLTRLLTERDYEPRRIREVFRMLDSLVRLPAPLQYHFEDRARRVRGERRMPLISPMLQRSLEEGIAKGRKAGQEEGRKAGQEEGIAKGHRQAILRVLAARFGEVPLNASSRLDRISDTLILQDLVTLSATVEGLREFTDALPG